MIRGSGKQIACGIAVLLCASALGPAAQAQDFLSALFGAFGGGRSHVPSIPLPFASEGNPFAPHGDARPRFAGGQAYCVRTCDGRYFPITASDNQSRAASCNSFCPASDTSASFSRVVFCACASRSR